MSSIEEEVMKYCYSRNLMLVTREFLEYRNRPIVVEVKNKDAIPIEWINKWLEVCTEDEAQTIAVMVYAWNLEEGQKENEEITNEDN